MDGAAAVDGTAAAGGTVGGDDAAGADGAAAGAGADVAGEGARLAVSILVAAGAALALAVSSGEEVPIDTTNQATQPAASARPPAPPAIFSRRLRARL
jgi:hypothetical protein